MAVRIKGEKKIKGEEKEEVLTGGGGGGDVEVGGCDG